MSLGYQKQLLMFAFEGRGSLQRKLLGIEREPGRGGLRARRRCPA
jgi:hypothetical protein